MLGACESAESKQNDWLYQLQYAEPDAISNSEYETVVMDPTRDGSNATRYTNQEISSIQENGTKVLAYISIGEASAFKSYWSEEWGEEVDGTLEVSESAPDWLGRDPNPAWPESVKVRYWEEEWWRIIEEELNRIQEAGFDGVYLDLVDAFEYWGDEQTYQQELRLAGDPSNREDAAIRMMELVNRMAAYLRDTQADFEVFPQNAESILFFDDGEYLEAINGIGIEDTWFREDQAIDSEEIETRLSYIKQVQDADKQVLSVDYVRVDSPSQQDKERVEEYYLKCREQGFACFAAYMDRELDDFIPR
ncbi:cysteinyl-tRNA synthetase, unknown class [Salimicrobium flavidum]|uniref:Glycoside-hydrolase family GH114 TIM-barrel domain-containing protein n=1 Tax=Salimicrobium flavidum TaxID=570947 RepID=A0A1N7JI67_9BACI|nr:cysteinyl-tRNA synthetase, unknown class [Salimicrobium flavidum]